MKGFLQQLLSKLNMTSQQTGRDHFEQVGGNVYTGEVHYHQVIMPSENQEQKGLREAYLNQVLERCGEVVLRGIDRKAASRESEACLHLDAIYTALLSQSVDQAERDFERSERRLSALELLNRHQRLVLLGDPGSGKSTFVNFAAMCMAGAQLEKPQTNLSLLTAPLPDDKGEDREERQPWEHGALLPLRIILRDFAAQGLPPAPQRATARHLLDFLNQRLQEMTLEAYAPFLQQHLRDVGGLILFDGLDEVQEADQRRTQIKQVIEDVAKVFPRCRILVTSRVYAYQQQEWRLSGFAEAVLAPFSRGQIQRFVDQWYRHSAQLRKKNLDNALAQAEILKRTILQNPRLYNLAERPLLLTLMASLHYWRGGSLPEKREELYNDTVDLLLDWWESPKVIRRKDGQVLVAQESLTELLNVGTEAVRNTLEFMAFQAHNSQSNLEGTADLAESELVDSLLNLSQNKDLRPARLIEYLSHRAGLLVPRGVRVYTFPHRTFQEYLAACYLTGSDDYPDNIAELARREPNRWREVLLLAGAKAARGAAASVWNLADALCYREPGDPKQGQGDAWGALLAGQALTENANLARIGDRHQAKASRIRDWLTAILTGQQPKGESFPTVERALAGNILAVLGDLRSGVGLREDGLPDTEWCEVPAGTFLMGSDPEGVKGIFLGESEIPKHRVALSTAYCIARYPVTNTQYRAFIHDNGYTTQAYWIDEGWEWKEEESISEPVWAGGEFDLPNHPVVGVSWYEATAFCRWLTQRLRETGELNEQQEIRLPTEAEWEKAARGADGRIFPWGDEKIFPELANYGDTDLGATSTIGCFPQGVSPYGCEEMAGNIYDWCLDCCEFDTKKLKIITDTYKDGLVDPLSVRGSGRVIRGGAWRGVAGFCRAAYRGNGRPASRDDFVGFRLLRTPL